MTRTLILGGFVVSAIFVVAGVLGSFYVENPATEGLFWLIAAIGAAVAATVAAVSAARSGESAVPAAGFSALAVASAVGVLQHSGFIAGDAPSAPAVSALFLLHFLGLGLLSLESAFGGITRLLAAVAGVIFAVLGFANLYGADLTPWENYAAVPWILLALTWVGLISDFQRRSAVIGDSAGVTRS